jgi:hypothetical protein
MRKKQIQLQKFHLPEVASDPRVCPVQCFHAYKKCFPVGVSGRLWKHFRYGKFQMNLPVGENIIVDIGKEIAAWLKLPKANSFTGSRS